MKGWIAATVLSASAFLAGAANAQTYALDPIHSSIAFRIKHANSAYVWGLFHQASGTFVLDADPAKVSVDVQIATRAVTTGNEQRDDHLRSADFFNAAQFPVIAFKSMSAKALTDDSWEVSGELTMKGVTRPLTVVLHKSGTGEFRGNRLAGVHAEFIVDRTQFAMEAHPALSSDVTLHVSLEGREQ